MYRRWIDVDGLGGLAGLSGLAGPSGAVVVVLDWKRWGIFLGRFGRLG